jgi:hypothetical protein
MDLFNAPVELFQEFVRSAYQQNLLQIQADEENKEKEKEEAKNKQQQQQQPVQSPSTNMEDIIDMIEEGG